MGEMTITPVPFFGLLHAASQAAVKLLGATDVCDDMLEMHLLRAEARDTRRWSDIAVYRSGRPFRRQALSKLAFYSADPMTDVRVRPPGPGSLKKRFYDRKR